jgi:ABC-type Fe3+/spermidine/putrescine transport system ATPase subunit
MNEFSGVIQDGNSVKIDLGIVHCIPPGGACNEVIVAIRPEDVALSREPSGQKNEFSAQLLSRLFLGDITVYELSADGQKIRGKTAGVDRRLEPGNSVYVRLPAEKLKIFPK